MRLEELKKANPGMEIYCVCSEEFKKYGRLVDIDMSDFCEVVKKEAVYPESGCDYVPAFAPIDTMPSADTYREILCGQLDEEWGLCWGYNQLLNGLEWHTCNEFNVGVTDAVLLLAKRADIDDNGKLDSAKVKAFYVPEGKVIEVYSDTLHYAPCQVSKDGFAVIVGLQRGTNEALEADKKKDTLVTAKNKWLIAHEDVEIGAVKGIYGENIKVNTID